MPEICIVIPVLNRPRNVPAVVGSIRRNTTVSHRILFMCSPGDIAEQRAVERTGEDNMVVPWDAGHADFAKKNNLAYRETDEPWLFFAADDLKFHRLWAENALAAAKRHHKRVIGTNDLGNPSVMRGQHSTHSLVARSYIDEHGTIDEPGKVFHEGYSHNWTDNELVETAMARGEWVFAADSYVQHLHPHWGHGPLDATYRKGLAEFADDRRLLARRRRLWKRRRSRQRYS